MSYLTAIIPSLVDVDKPYLKLCVESLRASGFDGDITVIANGTRDMNPLHDTPIQGISKFLVTKQQGQCFAVNQGAQMAEGDCKYLFIINSDMYFAPGWDKYFPKRDEKGKLPYMCFSPNLVEPDNNLGSAPPFRKVDGGYTLDEFNQELVDREIKRLVDDDHQTAPGFNLPLIIDIELWRTIGGYDTKYDPWGSGSDTDLQMKIELAGIMPMRVPDVLVYHFSNKSGTFDGTHQEEWWKNWNYLENKWGFNRDEAKSDTWYCKNMIMWDKLKYDPPWRGKYLES